ncbi:MAG: hypothetical protein VB112_02970 [Oscillospiraceae bacterium]|nr:hypothetical protein [Oscillospiraceae bacterium]
MSVSDKITLRRTARLYLVFAAICAVFGGVYEYFSHGVYSPFMMFMFAFPLLGAVAAFALSMSDKLRLPTRTERSLLDTGLATLTVGSCLRGIFDIYGSTVAAVGFYWTAGLALALSGAVLYARFTARRAQ